MNATLKGFLSGLLAGSITSAGAIITALQETPIELMAAGQWVTIGLSGFLASAVGWRTMLTRP